MIKHGRSMREIEIEMDEPLLPKDKIKFVNLYCSLHSCDEVCLYARWIVMMGLLATITIAPGRHQATHFALVWCIIFHPKFHEVHKPSICQIQILRKIYF